MDELRLEGKRVVLRPWRSDDIPALLRHGNNAAVARHMNDGFPHPYEQKDAEKWLELSNSASMRGKHFAIEWEGEAVGGTGFTPGGDVFRRSAIIGYWLGESVWGRGIASETLALLTDHVFATTDLVRLEGIVFAGNPASERVLEKCGYTLESRRPLSAFKADRLIETAVYVKLKS